MGNKLNSLKEKLHTEDSSRLENGSCKRKRNESDDDKEDLGRETPPPCSSSGLAPNSDIHTPKRKKLQSTSKYIYQKLFLDGENSDIKIHAFGQVWNLHKLYLSQSPFFACMFNGSWREAAQTEIDLDIPDPAIDKDALRTAFGSLYRDYVFIKPVEVVGVFAAASLLQLEGLIQQCITLMSNSMSADTVCSYYHASHRYNLESIKMESFNWLLINLLSSLDLDLLRQISVPLMTKLVSAPELFVMQVEMDVYSMLKKWMFVNIKSTWHGNEEQLYKDLENFYKDMTTQLAFLETEEGKQFIPAFKGLRWQHIVNDMASLNVLHKDRVINTDWLIPMYQQLWKQMLNIEQGIDLGPRAVPEMEVFNKSSIRCGRVLRKETGYCWRWVGYHYGLDLLMTYVNGLITMKRNTLAQSSPNNVSLQASRNIVYRLRIANLDNKGKISNVKSTEVRHQTLKKDEEVLVMTLDKKFGFPLYLSMDVLLSSPELSSMAFSDITLFSDTRQKHHTATQTEICHRNSMHSQTDSVSRHIVNVSGQEPRINYELGHSLRLKNQSLRTAIAANQPLSKKLSKSNLELIQMKPDLSSTSEQGSEDNG